MKCFAISKFDADGRHSHRTTVPFLAPTPSRLKTIQYGDLTATIQETTSNDGGEWRVNLTYTVEDSDLDILAKNETVNQIYTISVSDGTASFSTELRFNSLAKLISMWMTISQPSMRVQQYL